MSVPSVVAGQYVVGYNTSTLPFTLVLPLPSKATVGNTILVFILSYTNLITSVVDDAENTYQIASGPDTCTWDNTYIYCYKKENVVGTPQNITVTVPVGYEQTAGLVIEITGGASVATLDKIAFTDVNDRTLTWIGNPITPSNSDALLLGFGASDSTGWVGPPGLLIPGTDWTQLIDMDPTIAEFYVTIEDQTVSALGTYFSSWTNTVDVGEIDTEGAAGGMYTLAFSAAEPIILPEPTFNPAPGPYPTPPIVTVGGPPGATVIVTINGGAPLPNPGPISITSTTVIQAYSKLGGTVSGTVTATYTITPPMPICYQKSFSEQTNELFALNYNNNDPVTGLPVAGAWFEIHRSVRYGKPRTSGTPK